MSTINQYITGKGDSFAGSKNIYLQTLWLRQPIVLPILLAILLYCFTPQTKHLLGFDKVFTKSDTRFTVLILPFKQLCDDKRDVGEVIKSRLMELDKNDTLNIALYYANIAISDNFTND